MRCSLKLGFGRAHHRVLHFVNRNPGIKVADLLEILNITKQSLGRVLKQLIDQGYVSQKEGAQDRRQRLVICDGERRDSGSQACHACRRKELPAHLVSSVPTHMRRRAVFSPR